MLAAAALVFFLFCFASTNAWAQTAGDERARGHFKKGVALYDAQPPDYEGALAEFRAAYAQKSVPSLKRNIALCLRGLKRNVEAIETLEQMLLEGGDTIKPELRDAAKKAIAEMNEQIATVRLKVIVPGAAPTPYEVMLDGMVLPPDKAAQPTRMAPGEHAFVARARGYNDGFARVNVAAGQHDVPVQIDLTPTSARGRLHVKSSVPAATVALDGVPIAQGEWQGELGAGVHHVEVTAPGVTSWGKDVTVVAAQTVEVDARPGEAVAFDAPPPVIVPTRLPTPVYNWIIMGGASVHEGTRSLNSSSNPSSNNGPFFERAPATERGFWGAGVVLKAARKLGPIVLLEAWTELGGMAPVRYDTNGGKRAEVGIAYFELGPAIRLRSKGKIFRAVGGVAVGLEVESVTAKLTDLHGVETTQKGAGVSGCVLLEAGFQIYVSPRVFLEIDAFYNIYGVGATKSNATKERFFLDSPETRGGVRAMLGLEL
jgi:PEGA domain